ncbi:MAG: M23 family metallopeptidase [Bacteroidales bacterium]
MFFRNRKYIFDKKDLQFKQVRLPLKIRLLRFLMMAVISLIVSAIYLQIIFNRFGSPKEKMLLSEIESLKLSYSILEMKFDDAFRTINLLQQSDDRRYRPVLQMDSIPLIYRNPGYGGVDHYGEFKGLINSEIIITARQKIDLLKNMAKVQEESFREVEERKNEWKRENEYLPKICPVDVSIPRGDGIVFRREHPVLGTARWHYGQDFLTPYGTEVFATGSGTVVTAGWNSDGFGYHVIIDHGYGFRTIYAHLSKIDVPVGLNIKRGDRIGLSGNSGTSSGPHLHYQIDYNGTHQNPLWFFSDDLTPEEYRDMIMTLNSKSKFH